MEIHTTFGCPKKSFTLAKNNGRVLVEPRVVGRERGVSFVVIYVVPFVRVVIVVIVGITWIVVVIVVGTWIINRSGTKSKQDITKLNCHAIELNLHFARSYLLVLALDSVSCERTLKVFDSIIDNLTIQSGIIIINDGASDMTFEIFGLHLMFINLVGEKLGMRGDKLSL